MSADKRLVILDLGGVFFLQCARNAMLSYDLRSVYSEVEQHNPALHIYQDPETIVFLNQLLDNPGTTVAIWSPKHAYNAAQLMQSINTHHLHGKLYLLNRDLCKRHPKDAHGVQKHLDDVWQSAGINEFGVFSQRNTVIVDCSRSVVDCNPPENVVVGTPMNVTRFRGSHYLSQVLLPAIMEKFYVLNASEFRS